MRVLLDKAGHEMMVGARHRFSALEGAFRYAKAASKSLYQAHIRNLDQELNRLRWSDRKWPMAPNPPQSQRLVFDCGCAPWLSRRENVCSKLSKKEKNTSAAYPTKKAIANGGIVTV
jgi:hypothetical protein